mmetsp:Transcript_39300/g.123060  ORF Transcript_39300/g.123060 Transcript_39300/m.123060 type:complete len:248 (-) Transcript_39300:33-776(-)|eukprot:CAMPEP_0118855086 /NCGR_PEP_ID=MMETSP1163-20130328/3047_1 /TAXON_ID=124430 /ORGANISM="Phaeomonas parva, Strain CCMP2877" /LENGTH=247 /DNA_ID=CAMNT_0006787915 /DNA_START=164 /DNA_END=907 /DNA_ORIENTATION=+
MAGLARLKKAATAVKLGVAAAEAFKEVPHGIDGKTYFTSIPEAVRLAVPLLYSIESAQVRAIISTAVDQLRLPEGAADAKVLAKYERLVEGLGVSAAEVDVLFTGVFLMLRTALRQRTTVGTVDEHLKAMNVPDYCVSDIVSALRSQRAALETAALENRVRYPRCDGLKWRVDVIISTGQLSRVMRPCILMRLLRSDGSVATFEVSVGEFHQLRYSVAKALRSMQELERHPMMRLAFDLDRTKFDKK